MTNRIDHACRMIASMCSEKRYPKMSIPVLPEDEDVFIIETLRSFQWKRGTPPLDEQGQYLLCNVFTREVSLSDTMKNYTHWMKLPELP